MKFLRKLFETAVSFCILAAVAGGIWYFYGDYITSQVKYLLQVVETMEEDSQCSEQTAAMEEILENTYTHFSNQNLVECQTFEVRSDFDGDDTDSSFDENGFGSGYDVEDAIGSYNEAAWDKSQDIVRKKLYDLFYVQTFIQGPYNPDTYLSDSWTYYSVTDGQPRNFDLMYHTSVEETEVFSASTDTWYHHMLLYHYGDFRKGEYSEFMPYALLRKLEMKDYEEVGQEEFQGKQATHYIVTHKPLLRRPGRVIEEQYDIVNADGSVSPCSPIEYFEHKIDPRVRENYPEFYASFMELVDKRYYQDNQTHFWIGEDGTLLGIESDWTFEHYNPSFVYDDYEIIRAKLEAADSVTGEQFYIDFAQMKPVIKVAIFKYGDEVELITIPEECVSLGK